MQLKGYNGRNITIHDLPTVKMAWMQIGPNKDQGFQLCSETNGDYISYRESGTTLEKFAVSADSNGRLIFQLVLSGDGDEFSRLRNFTLQELEELIKGRSQ